MPAKTLLPPRPPGAAPIVETRVDHAVRNANGEFLTAGRSWTHDVLRADRMSEADARCVARIKNRFITGRGAKIVLIETRVKETANGAT